MKADSLWRSLLLTTAGLALLCLHGSTTEGAEERIPWLVLPAIDLRVTGDGAAESPSHPDAIENMIIYIPGSGSHIDYGTIHSKVNTESADIAMKSSSGSNGLQLTFDLTAAGGFRLQPGRNSVELEYKDQFGRQKYFNFLLTFGSSLVTRGLTAEPTKQVPEKRAGKIFAVVIGISQYDHPGSTIPNLQYADKDARSFLDFLKSPAGGNLPDDSVTLLLNDQATTQNIRHALFTFLTAAQPQDTVVIFIAGHGAPDPHDPRNLYLLTADSKADDMGATAFPMWQMQDVFERILKAKKVITIADTCHSYGFSGARVETEGGGNNLINQYVQHYASKGERAVITASDISESSYEDARWGNGHGVFTYYLLKGLQGEADKNHDGVVTAGELFAYLKQSVPQATEGKQNPRAMVGLASALPISILHGRPAEARPKSPASAHGFD